MGLFDDPIYNDPIFDLDRDGKIDDFELFVGLQMTATSREEARMLTGDDHFYPGPDTLEDKLEMAGIDKYELDDMDVDERRDAIEEAGLDPDDFDELW